MFSLQTIDSVCQELNTSTTYGLDSEQVALRQQEYGRNELPHGNKTSLWTLILQQFDDLLVRILLGAALVSFILAVVDGNDGGFSAFVEPLVILLILIANAIVSISQETKAESSLEALKKLQPGHCQVLRNGVWETVESADLVPGDVIHVRVGDKVPADARIAVIHSTTLRIEESQLTGESASVAKITDVIKMSSLTSTTTIPPPPTPSTAGPISTAANTPKSVPCSDKGPTLVPIVQHRKNMLFSSTSVVHGNCDAIVTATGMSTEVGAIHTAVEEAAEDSRQSPLQQKLDEFSQQLTVVIGLICVFVWIININHFKLPIHGSWIGGSIYYFKIAVALAVAAIPEGLPAVITTCLALGTKRMAKRNAIVRKLQSVETLGCTTVICSDKTGTMTDNLMTVTEIIMPRNSEEFDQYGIEIAHHRRPPSSRPAANGGPPPANGLTPEGYVFKVVAPNDYREFKHIRPKDIALHYLMRVAAVCNDSRLSICETTGVFEKTGEPTEAALKVLVEKMGCPNDIVNAKNLQKSTRTDPEAFCDYWQREVRKNMTLEFTRERRSMSVHITCPKNSGMLLVKGAPESIIERCITYMEPNGEILHFTSAAKHRFLKRNEVMAAKALRTLAMAVKLDAPIPRKDIEPSEFNLVERDLTFLGLVGMQDPPRQGVQEAVQRCRRAGIRVIMVTGDNQFTAEAIAGNCGLCTDMSGSVIKAQSLTGSEYEQMNPEAQRRFLNSPEGVVLSRMEPRLKQQIVKRLREMGEVVAMTGDGVNDAPALRQADIGISMGLSGTEVAKEASDMVLADDNFRTIVSAVEEGRSIYNNMKAFIRYLISSNIGEVASIFITAALGVPEGFAPIQLLWVNLVTDGPPATALGFNPPDLDVMTKAPRKTSDKLITLQVLVRYFVIGVYVGIATVGVFLYYFIFDKWNSDGHSLVTYSQLTNFNHCQNWEDFDAMPVYGMTGTNPCEYFTLGKLKASSLSLTVLVMIEMLNALNAISEDYSLLQRPPWTNPSLCVAVVSSVALHCVILYVAPLAKIFGVTPLDTYDWLVVLAFAFPVILADELIKCVTRGPKRVFYSLFYKLKSKAVKASTHI